MCMWKGGRVAGEGGRSMGCEWLVGIWGLCGGVDVTGMWDGE